MSDVKRYAVGLNGTAFMGMMERHSPPDRAHYVYGPEFGPMADYVPASDYDALAAENARLRRILARIAAPFPVEQPHSDRLQEIWKIACEGLQPSVQPT